MIEETSRRRDTFTPGVPVRLEDGQEWQFPRPRVRFHLTFRDDVPELGARTSLGRDYDEALKELQAAENLGGVAFGFLKLGVAMLRVNYDLTNQEASELLVYDEDDPDNKETWDVIRDVAIGVAPKHSTAGAV